MPGGKKLPKAEEAEEEEGGESTQAAMLSLIHVLMEEQKRAAQDRKEVREENIRREEQREKDRKKEQLETEKRLYDQQVELMRLQRELGEQATTAYREVQAEDKKRDRVLYNMPNFKDGEDLEEYFLMAERKMTAAKLPVGDWKAILEARFSGRIAIEWRDLMAEEDIDFSTAKDRILKSCGYTQRYAADAYHWFKADDCEGLTANQLYSRGQQLLRRMAAPEKIGPKLEFFLLKGWVGAVIPKRARIALDARVVEDPGALITALQDFLAINGEKGEGQTAVFRGNSFGENRDRDRDRDRERDRNGSRNCYNCGRLGHKAADCWNAKSDDIPKRAFPSSDTSIGEAGKNNNPMKIICFTCQEEGHKSPQCPRKTEFGKEVKTRPVNRISHGRGGGTVIAGEVNGQETSILIDSGASISIVPETMVKPEDLTGENVMVKSFGGQLMKLPIAEVPFKLFNQEWTETVAVAFLEDGQECEVLYGIDLESDRGIELIMAINKIKMARVNRIGIIAEPRKETEEVVVPVIEEVAVPVVGKKNIMLEDELECLGELDEVVEEKNLCLWSDSSDYEEEDVKEEELVAADDAGFEYNDWLLDFVDLEVESETENDILVENRQDNVKNSSGDQAEQKIYENRETIVNFICEGDVAEEVTRSQNKLVLDYSLGAGIWILLGILLSYLSILSSDVVVWIGIMEAYIHFKVSVFGHVYFMYFISGARTICRRCCFWILDLHFDIWKMMNYFRHWMAQNIKILKQAEGGCTLFQLGEMWGSSHRKRQ